MQDDSSLRWRCCSLTSSTGFSAAIASRTSSAPRKDTGAVHDVTSILSSSSVERPVTDRGRLVAEPVASLPSVREVLAAGEPEERKAVVRSFLAGIRVDRAAGRAVLRWYRLPQTAWVN